MTVTEALGFSTLNKTLVQDVTEIYSIYLNIAIPKSPLSNKSLTPGPQLQGISTDHTQLIHHFALKFP